MATIYDVRLEIVSDFCSYSEREMMAKILAQLDGHKDEKNGLMIRIGEIEVIKKA